MTVPRDETYATMVDGVGVVVEECDCVVKINIKECLNGLIK